MLRTQWLLLGTIHLFDMETLHLEVGARLERLPKQDVAF